MAEVRLPEHHVLLWGKSPGGSQDAEKMARSWCEQWMARKVSGVFFAPTEYTPQKSTVNQHIAELFEQARIPIVLIDRDLVDFPDRSKYDMVCIDHRRAAYVLTKHLLSAGCKRIIFVGRLWAAPSAGARSFGYREALIDAGVEFKDHFIGNIDPSDGTEIRRMIEHIRPDGIVCLNDFTAAHVMRVLEQMSLSVPDDVKVGGFDDVKYANLLQVPLTTIHQPCEELGAAAISAMIERLRHPGMPPRDVLLNFKLVVRASSGGLKSDDHTLTTRAGRS